MDDATFEQIREWCDPYVGKAPDELPRVAVQWHTRDEISWHPESDPPELWISPNEYIDLRERLSKIERFL